MLQSVEGFQEWPDCSKGEGGLSLGILWVVWRLITEDPFAERIYLRLMQFSAQWGDLSSGIKCKCRLSVFVSLCFGSLWCP